MVIRRKGESQNRCSRKSTPNFSKNISYHLIRWRALIIWRTLFSWNICFEIRPFALLTTNFEILLRSFHSMFGHTKDITTQQPLAPDLFELSSKCDVTVFTMTCQFSYWVINIFSWHILSVLPKDKTIRR